VGAARPRVVIIGGGFGGLYAARALAREPVDVTVVDRGAELTTRTGREARFTWMTRKRAESSEGSARTKAARAHGQRLFLVVHNKKRISPRAIQFFEP
jgi:2-polyprenyl-6-methoxyphenol hydroxylase-like FAD-dependent oxidoreductase